MDLLKTSQVAAQDFLSQRLKKSAKSRANHRVIFWGQGSDEALAKHVKRSLPKWQVERLERQAVQSFAIEEGTLWILRSERYEAVPETKGHGARLETSDFGRARDLCGSWLRTQKVAGFVDFQFAHAREDEVRGALVGLGLASYRFLDAVKKAEPGIEWKFSDESGALENEILQEAAAISSGMNLARHLTNLPAAVTNPQDLAQALAQFFRGRTGLKVEILNVAKLQKEKMGLLLGVGQGSTTGARLVHLRYRPTAKGGKKLAPLAFVGKGVTFDTGGLDIKPASGMRLMKKDMAGSAAVAGLCHFVTSMKLKVPCDFYLPLAENAISDRSMRPGDVLTARSGHLVEIDNTDAEGRLVMADAIHYAVSQKGADAPRALYDVSTLTGAMRVAVGLDVAGFFSTSDQLAEEVETQAQKVGEYAWRMPLVQKYFKQLSSSFADFKNSSDSGFGGAIVAALFLQKFVGETPWVHFDVMSWNSSADGALSDGANGQCFQTLASLLLKQGLSPKA